jgi:hypothetical protein
LDRPHQESRAHHSGREAAYLHTDSFGAIAHLWAVYVLVSNNKAVTCGFNGIEAVKEASGWRIASIALQPESPNSPFTDGSDIP